MNLRKHLRIALNGVKRGIDGDKQPAGTSASPGFGKHLVSGNDVIGITLVFGQTFVNCCAVGIAQRHGSRVRGKTPLRLPAN